MKIKVEAEVFITTNPMNVANPEKLTKEEKAELALAVENELNSRTEYMAVQTKNYKQVGVRFHFKDVK